MKHSLHSTGNLRMLLCLLSGLAHAQTVHVPSGGQSLRLQIGNSVENIPFVVK